MACAIYEHVARFQVAMQDGWLQGLQGFHAPRHLTSQTQAI
eukprot:CAMPEP_0202380624 /NCGR_PEP_ID=MMETSP1127-20130417/29829_1 /ASSEMBLY_ACC=CAM_ASM_000462 /TAXON_ID=3047 /ORGANISM="Dunaliella tertiolecta, Strain CCMP1320" /LENGTH=40 /DNA_ID= /DNA_START= /DNA_END= /DNA_ORIENTATION=